jgi:hypothetical protein
VAIEAALDEHKTRVGRLAAAGRAANTAAIAALRHQAHLSAERADTEAHEGSARLRGQAQQRWRAATLELDELVRPIAKSAAIAPWTAREWSSIPPGGPPAPAARAGSVRIATPASQERPLELPLLVPGLGFGHAAITAPATRREEAIGVLQGILLRLLAGQPPGHVRFRVHDPVGLGASLSSFSMFETPRVCARAPSTSSHELATIVEQLTSHVNTVSGEYLRGAHKSLSDFLAQAGRGFIPYEILVLLDYPEAVEPDLADQIVRLSTGAASRGLYLLLHQSSESKMSSWLPGDAVALTGNAEGRWQTSAMPAVSVSVDPGPPGELVEEIASRRAAPPSALWFAETIADIAADSATSTDALSCAIGHAGVRLVSVHFDDDIPHGLVAGDTGSGKSNLLRVLLYGLTYRYSPMELQLYLLDFKEGIEFREFAPAKGDQTFLPHARVVSMNSSRAFGVAVLEHLAHLIADRLHGMPGEARKLSSLRSRDPKIELPRILLVIDEFHVLFESADQLADRAVGALTMIGKQGRAAGVHFLLATQAIGDVGAGNANAARLDGVFSAARLRVALRLDDRESQTALRTGNLAAASLHERGMAIVNERLGHEDGNVLTRIALLEDSEATEMRREALSRVTGARRPPRVFEGDQGARPETNQDLRAAVRRSARAVRTRTWLGGELTIDSADPRAYPGVAADFTADPHRHLAVVGGGAAAAASVLQWGSIGLAASTRDAEFLLVDLLRDADDLTSGAAEATQHVLERLGCVVRLTRDNDARTVCALAESLLDSSVDAARFIVVFGMDRVIGLDEPIEPDSNDILPRTRRSQLERLLSDGGVRDTHLLAWWSTFDGLEQQTGMQSHNLGMHVYLAVPDQQLQIATSGRYDRSAEAPLALWHDLARGREPREIHLYESFGRADIPTFLAESPAG